MGTSDKFGSNRVYVDWQRGCGFGYRRRKQRGCRAFKYLGLVIHQDDMCLRALQQR